MNGSTDAVSAASPQKPTGRSYEKMEAPRILCLSLKSQDTQGAPEETSGKFKKVLSLHRGTGVGELVFEGGFGASEENMTKLCYELSSRRRREMLVPSMQRDDTVNSEWHQTHSA